MTALAVILLSCAPLFAEPGAYPELDRKFASAAPHDAEYKSVERVQEKDCKDEESGSGCLWVREEPAKSAKGVWRLWKSAPVEALSYRGDWVRVRDFEGDQGWLPAEALSDTATVCVKAKEGRVRATPESKGKVLWILDKGYALRVFSARGDWYEVSDLEDVAGWVHKSALWGAPPPRRKRS